MSSKLHFTRWTKKAHLKTECRYAPGTNCSYLLRGSPTQKVRIHFEKMKMTQKTPILDVGSECSEYLALYDADWPDPTRVMKVFCSFTITITVTITITITIIFFDEDSGGIAQSSRLINDLEWLLWHHVVGCVLYWYFPNFNALLPATYNPPLPSWNISFIIPV